MNLDDAVIRETIVMCQCKRHRVEILLIQYSKFTLQVQFVETEDRMIHCLDEYIAPFAEHIICEIRMIISRMDDYLCYYLVNSPWNSMK